MVIWHTKHCPNATYTGVVLLKLSQNIKYLHIYAENATARFGRSLIESHFLTCLSQLSSAEGDNVATSG